MEPELRLASARNYKDMFKEDEAGEFLPVSIPLKSNPSVFTTTDWRMERIFTRSYTLRGNACSDALRPVRRDAERRMGRSHAGRGNAIWVT